MTATVIGPSTLLQRLENCRGADWTTLDWGDGTTYASRTSKRQDCAKLKTHKYKSAGTYRIKATFLRDGPSGQPIVDWESDVEFVAK